MALPGCRLHPGRRHARTPPPCRRGFGGTRYGLLLALGLCLALCIARASAQEAVGGLRGRVSDADFQAAISGAIVSIEGTGLRVLTDEEGLFSVGGLPAGTYTVTVGREGYANGRVGPLAVRSGAFTEAEIDLQAEALELDEFVVAPLEEVTSTTVQLDIQKGLDSFATVLGADFISQIGASDVGKALTKVAGINVIGDRYVVIRGLADRYNAVLLNGAGVSSSDPDRRAPNIDLFPASIVRTLATSKTFTPDLPGEATGGSINIITKGFPEKNFAKIKLGLGYDTKATGNPEFLTYQGGGTGILGTLDSRRLPEILRTSELNRTIVIGAPGAAERALRDKINAILPRTMGASTASPPPDIGIEASMGVRSRFFDLPAGLLMALDYRKQYRFDDQGEEGRYLFNLAGDATLVTRRTRVMRGTESLRSSLLLVGGIEPQEGDELKLTFFSNLSAQDRASLRRGPRNRDPTTGEGFGDPDGYRESLTYTERRLFVLQLSGRHHWEGDLDPEQYVLNWTAAVNMSTQDEPDHRFIESTIEPGPDGGDRYTQISNAPIPSFRRYWREIDDFRWNIKMDEEILLFRDGEQTTRVKFGGGLDVATRDYLANNFFYNQGANNGAFFPSVSKPLPYPGATWGDAFLYGNPPVSGFANNPGSSTYLSRTSSPEFYDAFFSSPATFVMVRSNFSERFEAIFGFRYEQSNYRIDASDLAELAEESFNLAIQLLPPEDRTVTNIQDLFAGGEAAASNPAIQAASKVRLNESHVLPAFAAKYELTDEFTLRGAWSRTIARPSFKELAPVAFRDAESGDDFVGNSKLQISDIDNFDVRLEYYPRSGGGVAAVNFFSKFIQNPIELQNTGILQFVNSPDATIYGFELEFDRTLEFVEPSLRPFSIGANYAFLRSQGQRGQASEFGKTRRLQGQPDYIFNFNLTYDNKEYGLGAGLLLNVTGPYLDSVGTSNVPDILVDPVTSLNAFLSLKIGKNGKITLRANNLTQSPVLKSYDNGRRDLYELVNTSTQYSVSCEWEW